MRKMMLLLLLAAFACRKEQDPLALHRVAAPPPSQESRNAAANDAGASALAAPVIAGVVGGVAGAPVTAKATPMIVRTATVTIIVGDTARSIDRITSLVEQNGGYVSASNIWRETEQLRGKLTVRIPSTRLHQTLAAIRTSAIRIQSETMTSDEVTQEYVDLGSQLRNFEATESELRELMTAVREHSRKASEVLEMSQQLTAIRGQIEQARGRMRYLEQMTSYATVNVELIPDAVAKPVVEAGWQPVAIAKDAARALTNVLKEIAAAAIWLLIYALPIVLLLCLGAAITWKVVRRVVAARTA
jgi:hypothetical protein